MFPLISTLDELRKAKMVLKDAMEDLDEQGGAYDKNISVGMMVEVPSAVVMIDQFVKEVDFISIGTNDLAQYALAVDRSNKEVSHLFQAVDPAVLRLINTSIQAAQQAGIPASVCGQMSSTPAYAMVLLGLGIRHVSVTPIALPEIKKLCRNVTIEQCAQIAQRALAMDNALEIDTFLQEELRRAIPVTVPHLPRT